MSDLGYAKQIIASVQARLETLSSLATIAPESRQEARDMADELGDALGAVCMADVMADADGLMERAKWCSCPPDEYGGRTTVSGEGDIYGTCVRCGKKWKP
jgi:hypothetical protein